MAENLNIFTTVEAWTDILLDRLYQSIYKHKILNTWQLHDSLSAKILGGQKSPEAIALEYLYYGKFVEMGVGKGVRLENRNQMQQDYRHNEGGTRRKPKKWISKIVYSQTLKLRDIMMSKYGKKGAFSIVENLDDNATKWRGTSI